MMHRRVICSRSFIPILLAIGFSLSNVAQADPPVVDLSSSTPTNTETYTPAPVDTSDMSTEQRLSRLENIVAAQNNVALLNQMNTLQQQMQQLQGKIDLLQRQVIQLQSQTTQQYADVDTRLKALEAGQKAAPPITGDIVNEQQAYQKAYDAIKAQNYAQAEQALNAYIKQYPQGSYVPNSYYWLGEVSLAQGQVTPALNYFKTVITKYPTSNKAPDALLKAASVNAELGNKAEAKQQLQQIIQKYPNSSTVPAAKTQLAKLK